MSQQLLPQPQEGDAASETSSQAPSQQQQQPPPPPPPQHAHQMPMYIQQGYYPGGQIMHPGLHPQQFMHPAQVAAMQHQQRQMGYPPQPGHMLPNMMRAPNGMPYYAGPGGPMPYPQYASTAGYADDPNLDNSMNSYGGRGRGGVGRTHRGGGRPGRGPRGGGRPIRGGGIGRTGYQQPHSSGYNSNNSIQPDSGLEASQQQQPHPPQHGYEPQSPLRQPLQSNVEDGPPEVPSTAPAEN